MSPTATKAPSAAISTALARPIPEAPPVTIATFPCRRCTRLLHRAESRQSHPARSRMEDDLDRLTDRHRVYITVHDIGENARSLLQLDVGDHVRQVPIVALSAPIHG